MFGYISILPSLYIFGGIGIGIVIFLILIIIGLFCDDVEDR